MGRINCKVCGKEIYGDGYTPKTAGGILAWCFRTSINQRDNMLSKPKYCSKGCYMDVKGGGGNGSADRPQKARAKQYNSNGCVLWLIKKGITLIFIFIVIAMAVGAISALLGNAET